ncbi:MAG: hypothetical protein LLG20_18625 [Acidobacteriales bacterium]|nr:hypothetical protein [Terriglobales bacterium]
MIELIPTEKIPTRDRADGLVAVIRSLLANPGMAAKVPVGGRKKNALTTNILITAKRLGCRATVSSVRGSNDFVYVRLVGDK